MADAGSIVFPVWLRVGSTSTETRVGAITVPVTVAPSGEATADVVADWRQPLADFLRQVADVIESGEAET